MIPYPVIMGAAQGLLFDPLQFSNAISQIKHSGLTQIQLSFVINPNADILAHTGEVTDAYGDIDSIATHALVVTNGMYVFSSRFASLLLGLTSLSNDGSSIRTVSASIYKWEHLSEILLTNQATANSNARFINTILQRNFRVFRNTFPDISIIDINLTNYFNASPSEQSALIPFILMLNSLNFGITFSLNAYPPTTLVTAKDFATFLATLIQTVQNEIKRSQTSPSDPTIIRGLSPNLVRSLNLLYNYGDSTGQIVPSEWAYAIDTLDPRFTTNGFIIPGFYTIGIPAGGGTVGDTAAIVQEKISKFSGDACVGGGFFRTIDHVIVENKTNELLIDYANAICLGLNEVTLTLTAPDPYTIRFVPVNGEVKQSDLSKFPYAFCSPVFTLEVLNSAGPLIPPLPLQWNGSFTGQQFNIFPQPMNQLNPTLGWIPEVNLDNVFTYAIPPSLVRITIQYSHGNELIITLI